MDNARERKRNANELLQPERSLYDILTEKVKAAKQRQLERTQTEEADLPITLDLS